MPKQSKFPIRCRATIIIVFFLFLFLPYLDKAFHVDDWVFLTGADRILNHFDSPYDGRLEFFGENITYYQTTHPPLFFFFIGGLIWFYGETSEIILHLGNIVFPALAVFFFYQLSRLLIGQAFVATLLFLTSYAFVVNAHNIMSDVPTIAMMLGALYFFVLGHRREKSIHFVWSGLLATICWGIGYQGMPVLGLIVIYAWIFRMPLRRCWPALVLPFGIFLVWAIWTHFEYGISHILVATEWPGGRVAFYNPIHILNKLRANLAYLGSFVFIPLCIFLYAGRRKLHRHWLPTLLVLSLSLNFVPQGYFLGNHVLMVLFFGFGIWMICLLIARIRQVFGSSSPMKGHSDFGFLKERWDRSITFLAFWMVSTFLICILFGPYGIVRYALLFLPPTILVVAKELGSLDAKVKRMAVPIVVFAQTMVTSLVAASDYALANTYRDFSQKLKYEFEQSNQRIWYSGELGTRWYFDRAGFEYLNPAGRGLRKGDLVVRPVNDFGPAYEPVVYPRIYQIRKIDYFHWSPLLAHSRIAQAGFYSHYFGIVPFALSRKPIETFLVFRVVK